MNELRIAFIGAGNMAASLIGGLRAQGVPAERIRACDPSAEQRARVGAEHGIFLCADNAEAVAGADVVVLAVKPQHLEAALADAGPLPVKSSAHPDGPLWVSIVAGVPLAALARGVGSERIVRVMPNTPSLIGLGAAGFALGPAATAEDRQVVESMFGAVGIALPLPEELLDAVTGLSGSGPALVYEIIDALADGGVRTGLPRHVAQQLAAQTVYGAAAMVLRTGEHPAVLKDRVASPGGTTIAGLHAVHRGGLRGILMDAVQAATRRSRKLGKKASAVPGDR